MRIRTLHRGHSIDELEQTLPHMREESGGPISWELIGKPHSKPSLIWGCYCVYMRLARFFWMKNDPQVVWRETREKTVGPSNISRIPLHIISYYCRILLVHNLFSCVPRFLDFCTGCVYHGYLQESIPPTHAILPHGSGKYWSQLVCSLQRWIDLCKWWDSPFPVCSNHFLGRRMITIWWSTVI